VIKKSVTIFSKGQNVSVDAEAGVIKNVVIVQAGRDKDGDNWDATSLSQIIKLGNEQTQGVKSRNGHPNACDSSIGSFIGRYKNFSTSTNSDGREVVVADLHLDPITKKVQVSGKGISTWDYIIDMAKSNSDMFGNSVMYRAGKPEVKTEKDDSGNDVRVPYERPVTFPASDIVDSPSATTSLFKDDSNFAAIATQFLEENPDIFEVLSKNENVFNEFLSKYKSFKNQKEKMKKNQTFFEKMKALINGEEEAKASHTTSDGKKINIDGDVAVGSGVTDEEGKPTPNASYTLEDGTKITTDADSKIATVTAAEATPATDDKKAINDLKAEKKSLEDQLAAEKSERAEEQKNIMVEIQKMKTEITTLKSQITSRHVPKPGGTKFKTTQEDEAPKNRVRDAFPKHFKKENAES
jgi:hypothetical protein